MEGGSVYPIPVTIPGFGHLTIEVTPAEKYQFIELWKKQHLYALKKNKIVHCFPARVLDQMHEKFGATYDLLATRLSNMVQADIYVHFDHLNFTYRIGQVTDQEDFALVAPLEFICHKQYTAPQQVSMAAGIASSSSYAMGTPAQQLQLRTSSGPSDASSTVVGADPTHPKIIVTNPPKIRKPRNSWILYRQSKHHLVSSDNPGLHTSEISPIIAKMWQNEPADVKAHWHRKAHEEKSALLRRYPGWKPTPRKSSAIKRRKTTKKVTQISLMGSLTSGQLNSSELSADSNQEQTGVNSPVNPLFDSSNEEFEYIFSRMDSTLDAQMNNINQQVLGMSDFFPTHTNEMLQGSEFESGIFQN